MIELVEPCWTLLVAIAFLFRESAEGPFTSLFCWSACSVQSELSRNLPERQLFWSGAGGSFVQVLPHMTDVIIENCNLRLQTFLQCFVCSQLCLLQLLLQVRHLPSSFVCIAGWCISSGVKIACQPRKVLEQRRQVPQVTGDPPFLCYSLPGGPHLGARHGTRARNDHGANKCLWDT